MILKIGGGKSKEFNALKFKKFQEKKRKNKFEKKGNFFTFFIFFFEVGDNLEFRI